MIRCKVYKFLYVFFASRHFLFGLCWNWKTLIAKMKRRANRKESGLKRVALTAQIQKLLQIEKKTIFLHRICLTWFSWQKNRKNDIVSEIFHENAFHSVATATTLIIHHLSHFYALKTFNVFSLQLKSLKEIIFRFWHI